MVSIHLKAPALVAQALLPLMKKEGAAMVNISSDGALHPRETEWDYDATRTGMCSLSRSMAIEFWKYGIGVNTVAPGWLATEMHYGTAPDPEAKKREPENLETFSGDVPNSENTRVFCYQGGHDNQTFANPNFRTFVERGMKWVARRI